MSTLLPGKKVGITMVLVFFLQWPLYAHVKWFSPFSFAEKPLTLSEILTPLFLTFAVASTLAIGLTVYLDNVLISLPWYKKVEMQLSRYADKSDLIIRVATGAVLLLSWHSQTWLVPELMVFNPWIELFQLVLAFLILFNRYTRYAGAGVILLYLIALLIHGILHLFDYLYILGVGYYLIVASSSKKNLRALALPGLYASVGFSLCWVAIEKIVYPQWALDIFTQRPYLTMGFDPDFFLLSAAFVEFSLGFLLIVCLLQRPIALAITLLFISTTFVFGKLEFVGHAIVHAVLIVFILKGAGTTFRTPITFFYHIHQRVIFAVFSFALGLMTLVPWYAQTALRTYEVAVAKTAEDPHDVRIEMASVAEKPSVELIVEEDNHSGWNLYLDTSNFQFSPEDCGEEHVEGFGHAHLYINGQKVARLYSPWYHLTGLRPGEYDLRVTLNSNNHGVYTLDGRAISGYARLVVK